MRRLFRDSFFRNTIWLTSLTLFGSFASYLWQVFANRNLDPGQYGLLNALLASTVLVSIFADILRQWALKGYTELAAHRRHGELGRLTRHYAVRVAAVFLFILLFTTATTFLAPGLFKFSSPTQAVLFTTILLLSFSILLPGAFLDAHQLFHLGALAGFFGALSRLGFLALFLLTGFTLAKALASHILAATVTFTLLTLVALVSYRRLPERQVASHAPVSAQGFGTFLRIGLASSFLTIILNQDMPLARALLDPSASGHWATLSVFGKAVFYAATAALPILFVSVADRFNRHLPYGRAFLKSLAGVAAVSLSGLAALTVFIDPFVRFLNPAYRDLVPEILTYAAISLPYIFINFFTVFYVSVSRFRLFAPMLLLAGAQSACYATLGKSIHGFLWVRGVSGVLLLVPLVFYFAWKRGHFYPTDGELAAGPPVRGRHG